MKKVIKAIWTPIPDFYLWSSDDEEAGWLDVEDGSLVEVAFGDDHLDNLLHDLLAQLLDSDLLAVLARDDHCVHADRHTRSLLVLVLNGHLVEVHMCMVSYITT